MQRILITSVLFILFGSITSYAQLDQKEKKTITDHTAWVDENAEFMESHQLNHISNKRVQAFTDRYGLPFLIEVKYSYNENAYFDKYYLQNNKVILITQVNSIDNKAAKYYFVDGKLKEYINHIGEVITKKSKLPLEKEKETEDFINGIMAELKKEFKH